MKRKVLSMYLRNKCIIDRSTGRSSSDSLRFEYKIFEKYEYYICISNHTLYEYYSYDSLTVRFRYD
jgi:hypothetical protein